MHQKHLVSITNIPTPYRVHFYQQLYQKLSEVGISLDVMFMAHTELGRYWEFKQDLWEFSYQFVPGVHPEIGGRVFHMNPGCLFPLWRNPPDWLLLSGSWFLPTVQLTTLLAKRRHTKTLFWSESNLAYVEHMGKMVRHWRQWMMDQFDAFVVPGVWAKDYVLHFSPGARDKPFVQLPNIVDEHQFRDEVSSLRSERDILRHKWGIESDRQPVLLTIARLEPIKGIKQLVQATVSDPHLNGTLLLIAGTGSLQSELNEVIQYSEGVDRVRLLGHLSESSILELLALADGLVLPSLGDPYPLVVIEAAFAGLPLLLSNRVGCHPEALVEGENGFLFDPENQDSIQRSLRSFKKLGEDTWYEMGKESSRIAAQRFETGLVINRFVDALMQLA